MQSLKFTVWGYGLIVLLIGCVIYTWLHEWQEVEALEIGKQQVGQST